MELEEFVSGHMEISNEPGIWSWVSLIPKDHGFPTVYVYVLLFMRLDTISAKSWFVSL